MFKGRSLLCLLDFEAHEIEKMLDVSFMMKNFVYSSSVPKSLEGKKVALLFEKPSTRTRVSSELAISMLGGIPIVLNKQDIQLSRGEPVEDTARVLGKMVNGIGARVLKHETLIKLKEFSKVPIFNLLSDLSHPLQALADIMTIREKFGKGYVKIAFVGDGGDNVLLSLMSAVAKLGLELHVASPKELRPREDYYKLIEEISEITGAIIEFHEDPYEAVRGAHVVYTDVWVSMGQEEIAERKKKLLGNYKVTSDLMKYTARDSIFMHCLPANRGEEVDQDVIDGPRSVVWDQAENRLYTAMSVFSLFI
ncbi:ornithine carbamoyltransferase [Sulfolobus sp. A20]|uniref:ornithine carbamoyltransferase n=1 Tax=Sulfolobaceae TaxID=118883 RepID=UPI000845F771|nr:MULTISPECIES: ornithine carbamoyltransferase [unclassified Sulfolobus]TRM74587.1 ornithine carbamoyltransferase [Sulfolobus sp. E5]TRM78195.1 ornithine carbamoyltransferase [Sulfolobus sp. A20-N-F8]TRM81620.1 ornithine carbamoyltransferase [Sulfolobus sp. D5]TRM82881.1 ornithine carbamoyltransferase [Sulfolobus sp. A20-N-F6]TRM88858.1 ornithine carbamoyltransferase [Sulfolobus sp. C3]TRN01195.1 ornithine carbamoyltransferase [Sulfolobus sp. E1]